MSDTIETPDEPAKFDPSAFPADTFFYERRDGNDRRADRPAPPEVEHRRKKERRRRVDPTTFEKQYSADELEFMTAMQEFKIRTAKAFPTYAEVLAVARALGYHRPDSDAIEGQTAAEANVPVSLPFPPPPPPNGTAH
ncbi:MAG TPA: hypothetical protein VGH33_06290 [Isosphaeraceae bacterium]